MLLNIGYPIGIVKNNGNTYYGIEIQKRIILISNDELQVWVKIDLDYTPENVLESTIIERLKRSGLVIEENDKANLIKKLLSNSMLRQGFGNIQEYGNCIQVHSAIVNVTERQLRIWQLSNGNNSIESILGNLLKFNFIIQDNTVEDLFEDIIYLYSNELVYIV